MPTRTWLTTPPGQEPSDDRGPTDEIYVPAADLPFEPRVAGRHRRGLLIGSLLLFAVTLGVVLVVVGESAQREDPAVPAQEPQQDAPEGLELPES